MTAQPPIASLGLWLVASLGLCACTTPAGFPAVGEIIVASGWFGGTQSTQIFSDGTVIRTDAAPGQVPIRTIRHGLPAVYNKAAAVLAAEGLATRRALGPHPQPCLDYGTDRVAASPAIAGFDRAEASCPDPALTALMRDVLAAGAMP